MGKLAITEPTEADAEQERAERLQEAIFQMPTPLGDATAAIWRRLRAGTSDSLRGPALNLRESGGTLLTWRSGVHHFDVEIEEDGALDFFYLNLDTDDAWDIETALPDASLPEPVLRVLPYFHLTVDKLVFKKLQARLVNAVGDDFILLPESV